MIIDLKGSKLLLEASGWPVKGEDDEDKAGASIEVDGGGDCDTFSDSTRVVEVSGAGKGSDSSGVTVASAFLIDGATAAGLQGEGVGGRVQ